jgi:glutathione S-transferase
MKLYLHPNAPNCMKVVMTAAQLDVTLESEFVDLLTLADISVAAFLMYARPARAPLEDYQHIRSWLARMEGLPSWKSAQPPPGA